MEIELVTPTEAKQALDEDDGAVYIDVRTEREFAAGHPRGAINIPAFTPGSHGGLETNREFVEIVSALISPERRVLCGCQMGGRSMAAAEMLAEHGFGSVANVIGGYGGGPDPRDGRPIPGWSAAGLPVSTDVDDENSYAALRRKAGKP